MTFNQLNLSYPVGCLFMSMPGTPQHVNTVDTPGEEALPICSQVHRRHLVAPTCHGTILGFTDFAPTVWIFNFPLHFHCLENPIVNDLSIVDSIFESSSIGLHLVFVLYFHGVQSHISSTL